ncbi:Crp/Fnr family transcriptional regulator [Paenibacillus nanensis]|uniref:Crp/Fnr family transcriptional regulator n=1 Tax=Paenibacillus nanensis TaxID=393251 RepID=A0A3A1UU59_9BACL|nr:Crp/Fnr family transcriptional regulator [Paenibacillus nanensis]RIX52068.1 Crp/Fnr family transcriptional regulator [Paenibacillus nanensis]
MDKIKYLSRIKLFDGLELEQLQKLEPVTPLNIIRKNRMIAFPGELQKRLFLIKSGVVRLYRISSTGKELTVDLLGSGHIFGEVGSFTTGTEHLYAETKEDSVICTLDKDQFEAIVMRHPELGLKFIEMVSSRLKEMEEMLEMLAYGSIRQRLLYLLHKLAQKFGRALESDGDWLQLEISMTHQELASMAGSIRETVTEQLNQFVSEGLVRKAGPRSALLLQPERIRKAMHNSV